MNDFIICRTPENIISGYKKVIDKTLLILNKHFKLVSVSLFSGQNHYFQTPFNFDKTTFNSPELFISPILTDSKFLWSDYLPDKKNISVFTMWESTVLPRLAVKELNDIAEKVFVPSEWNVDVFKNSGVNNVYYMPLFVDDKIFNYRPKKNLSKFTFFAGANMKNFSLDNQRKNILSVIDCFLKTFKNINDVELIIKATDCNKTSLPIIIDDRIKYIFANLPENNFIDLFSETDVYISTAKSEGWGFFQIESLAIGRPVITINYGGITDFCNSENSFFVDYEEELASGCWGKRGGLWACPKQNSIMEQMKYCYDNKDTIRNNWKKYSDSVINKFSLSNYESRLIEALLK